MPKPDDLSAFAVSEGGITVPHTYSEVELSLKVLVMSGGNIPKSVKLLKAEGLTVNRRKLQNWRDRAFASRYIELRSELAPQVSEESAARAMERALQTDDVEADYIAKAHEKIDEVSPDKLAASVLSLAKAKAENITKAQLLRERPTEIRGSTDTSELLEILRRNGVLAHDPRTHETIVDAEVVVEEDPLLEKVRARLADPG